MAIWRLVKWLVIKPAAFVAAVAIMLAVPPVQTFLARFATQYLSEKTGFQITIQKIHFNLLNQDLLLKGLKILDKKGEKMMDLEELSCDFSLYDAIQGKNIFLDKFALKKGKVSLVLNPDSKELNIQEFIDAIENLTAPKEKKPRKPGERAAVFAIEEVFLDEIIFSYHDPRQDSIKNGFDYAHFQLEHLDGYLGKLLIVADTVAFEARNLQAMDKASGLTIKDLNTNFFFNKTSMRFDNLYAEVNNSILQDSLVFNFESGKDFGDFNNKIHIEANLDSTILHTHDLALFAPDLYAFDDVWHLKGIFSGTVRNFNFLDFNISFGQKSQLFGSFSAEGLPDVRSLLASLQFEEGSLIHTPDLAQYVNNDEIQSYVQKFGDVNLTGRFDGYIDDFKANVSMQSALGKATLDAYFIQKNNELPAYEGQIALENFEIGSLFNQVDVGSISMEGGLKGRGFTLQTLDTDFDGNVYSFEALNYTYQDIYLNGHFKNRFFGGTLRSDDENANLELEGTIDFSKKEPELRISSQVVNVDLQNLKLSPEKITFIGFLHLQSKGLYFDDFMGEVLLREATLGYRNKTISFDSLLFTSQTNEYGYRFLDLYSEYATVGVVGKYNLSQLGNTLSSFFDELLLGLKNRKDEKIAYYEQKRKKRNENLSLEYDILIHQPRPLLHLFDTTAFASADAHFKGILIGGDSARLTFKSVKPLPSIQFGKYHFFRNNVQFEAYKNRLDDNITAELNLYSHSQQLSDLKTEKLSFQAIWLDGIIDFRTKIKQQENDNQADLQGHITLDTNKTIIEFEESAVTLLKERWLFTPEGKIIIFTNENGKIVFDKCLITNKNQEIAVDGMIAENFPDEKLKIDINTFQLASLNDLLGNKKLSGILDAHLLIEDVYEQIKINANFRADSVVVNKFFIGDIKGVSAWNTQTQLVDISLDIFHKKDFMFFLSGTYNPREDYLDILARLRDTEINIVEPFVEEFVSKLEGTVSGDILVTGKLNEPNLSGFVKFKQAKFKINYLGTIYETNSQIDITKNELLFNKFVLTDRERQNAALSGRIYHEKFQHFFIELNGDFERFSLLNIKEQENALYYGTAIASGRLMIQGEPEDIYIKIDATTDRGTKIYLPLDGYSEVGDANYYQFVDFEKENKKDSTNLLSNPIKTVKLSGLQMDMNLNVTEDAYFEIQLDRQTGDIMKGYGKGLMQMGIDSRGNFGIWGDYNITRGSYHFTMKNLISKKFNIMQGSKIYFEGDVYKAYMDVKASYDDAHPSFTAFLPASEITPETSRRFPVSVIAHLIGDLLAPKVNFKIDFKDIEKKISNPTLQAAMFKVKSDIENNELELNRQVGSLIILGQFTSESAGSSVGIASGRTLGEFLSNQLSSYISKIDENLEIDLNASDLIGGQNGSNLIGMRFSYTLLDGRLKVISDNRLDNRQQGSNYTGEWIVEYTLTEDGRYKLKMYNRSTLGNNNIMQTTANSTGISFSQTHNFNSFKDLFKRKKKKEKNFGEKKPEQKIIQQDSLPANLPQ
ncbi:MAG: translocation/assembly module TamB domain-containing protein [Raineya sp.]